LPEAPVELTERAAALLERHREIVVDQGLPEPS
jgi:hypothetical protein